MAAKETIQGVVLAGSLLLNGCAFIGLRAEQSARIQGDKKLQGEVESLQGQVDTWETTIDEWGHRIDLNEVSDYAYALVSRAAADFSGASTAIFGGPLGPIDKETWEKQREDLLEKQTEPASEPSAAPGTQGY